MGLDCFRIAYRVHTNDPFKIALTRLLLDKGIIDYSDLVTLERYIYREEEINKELDIDG